VFVVAVVPFAGKWRMAAHEVRIGTSGWNYPAPGYGPWTGIFYPLKQGQKTPGTKAKFDELAYYAERFNTVEINNTFYRPPAVTVAKSWATRTPKDFEFSLKIYQKFTHEREVTRQDADVFKRGIEPLANAHKLRALLCQFPASFKRTDASVEYLISLLETFADYGCAVELRHRSWSDDFGPTLQLLNERQAAFVQIDEPKFKHQSAKINCPTLPRSITCARTAGTLRSGGATTTRTSATTTCTSPRRSRSSARR
jgi:uncharacterized protein YecE (DUF72 family)